MISGSNVYKSLDWYLKVQKKNTYKFYYILTISDTKTIETWKMDDFR